MIAKLAQILQRQAGADGMTATALPRVHLIRSTTPTEPIHVLHQPEVCWVAQGRKQTMLGDDLFVYQPNQFLIISAELPITGQILDASPLQPYLCLRLDFDPAAIGALIDDLGAPLGALGRGVDVSQASPELLDAVTRLAALLEAPQPDQRVLAPLAEREILYRLLQSDQGERLRQIAHADSKLARINRAIAWIKTHYQRPLRVEEMAAQANMSPSSFHEHFRTVTALSPLQYLKQIRLQEARRMMLAHSLDAATAGFNVGYESASQFSREYARCFGLPPRRDVDRMRGVAAV